jgi:hypothetical protein
MTRTKHGLLGLSLGAAAFAACVTLLAPAGAQAQMVPTTVDPYELAPRNIHLYPISLNARIPFQYVPPIFAPRAMWRGALTAEELHGIAPHNWTCTEVPDSTALVAWGTVKTGKKDKTETIVMESANQQEFLFLPPAGLGSNDFIYVKTSMRWVPKRAGSEVEELLERELITEPGPRVNSLADELPIGTLMSNYERVEDVADLQPRIHPSVSDEMSTNYWPVDRIYTSYAGWRRDPQRLRTMGDFVPQWFTYEGKLMATKEGDNGWYLLTVNLQGYNPWYPTELSKNVMRKLIARSFDEFVEPTRYYDVELPLDGKEWHRQGSGDLEPHDTRKRAGTGGAGQGGY